MSPIILSLRLTLKICTGKHDWDNKLLLNFVTLWNKLVKKLKVLEGVPASRHVLCKCGKKKLRFNDFYDSSGVEYTACIYILSRCCHGVTVNLVASKCRLVPSKSQTIPWLELLSCLLLCKLLVSVLDVISQVVTASSIFCWSDNMVASWWSDGMVALWWSDSMVALWWIKQVDKRWNIWVQNRVHVIRANSSPANWFHIPSLSDPVDISTRSISLAHLDLLHWFHGTQFLHGNPKNWSPKNVTLPFGEINLEEITVNIVVATVGSVEQDALGKLFRFTKITNF